MSYSRFLHDRFQRHRLRRGIIAALYVVTTLAYLAWRTTILNPEAMTLSLVYYGAEIVGFILGLTLVFSSWTFRHREPKPAPCGLKVDVFVTAYREDRTIIRRTLIAARDLQYPHSTILLDDGNRAELRALANELGVDYAARGENSHAKAGNLRFGFARSRADFVMSLDADHIVLPHALDIMLGFFSDPNVAMVQTPQDYYNIDSFQYFNARNGGLWHDQSFFYSIAQPCRDAFNGASCVGTSVVYRKSAIEAIGGIPAETVTEDMHTSLRLHKAGFEVVFLCEPVAHGIAATDLRDYYRTRHRWAHGNLHVLRAENVLFCRGLTLGQRLSYLTLGLIYFEGWQQLALFIVPIVSLLMGWAPFHITIANVLAVLLFPIFTALLLQELGCGLSRYWVNEIFAMARFPIHLISTLGLFGRPLPFRSSFKNLKGRLDWRLLIPQGLVLSVSVGALAFGLINMDWDLTSGPFVSAARLMASGKSDLVDWNQELVQGYTIELVVVAGFWALFNAARALYLILKAKRDARNSYDDYRFDAWLAFALEQPALTSSQKMNSADSAKWARVDKCSMTWAQIRLYNATGFTPGMELTGNLILPAGPIRARARILSIEPDKAGPGATCECGWVWDNEAAQDKLARTLFSVEWHREFRHRNTFFATPLDLLTQLIRGNADGKSGEWVPALKLHQQQPQLVVVETGGTEIEILAFEDHAPGATVQLLLLDSGGPERCDIVIDGIAPLRTLATRGHDGAILRRYYGHRLAEAKAAADVPQPSQAAAE